MAANIAPTSFGTTPDDKAVVVDVYSTPPLIPTNNSPGTVDADAVNQGTGASDLGKNLLKQIAENYTKKGKPFGTRDERIASLGKNFDVSKGQLKTLSSKFLDSVLQMNGFYDTGIGKVVNGIVNVTTGNPLGKDAASGLRDLSVTVAGVKTYIKNLEDINSLTDLSNLIGSISGDNAFIKALNLTEIAATIKGVNDIAKEYSITGVIDKLMSDLDNDDKRYVSALVISGTTSSIDITTIDTMLTYLSSSELLSANPNIIKMLLTGFTANATYPTASEDAATALLQRLNAINPHWFQVKVDADKWIDDLDVFTYCSSFARESFLLANLYKAPLAIASTYRGNSFLTLANRYYPFIGLPA